MPIYLDRHEMKGVTAAEIAALHLKDLDIQDRYGVKYLTYWFDAERGTTFCLVDAPTKELAERVHREAHGGVAHQMIAVDLSAVEAFLGRVGDPKPTSPTGQAEMDGGFRAILFTDIVGSTEITARLGDTMGVELVRAHDSLVRRALARHDGREVKHTGDGIMAAFDAVPAAVDCARAIQRAFAAHNDEASEPIHVRIGLHAGEPVADRDDLFGVAVQLAARLCQAAGSEEIVASATIQDLCPDLDYFVRPRRQRFKGFAKPIEVFSIAWR